MYRRGLQCLSARYFSSNVSHGVKNLDLCLCVDLTRSMEEFIEAAQESMHLIVGGLQENKVHVRLGIKPFFFFAEKFVFPFFNF